MSTTSSQTVQVVLPELGESVTEGVVVEWRIAEGDEVRAGDPLLDVTTDKVDVEVPAPTSGRLVRIVAQPGDAVEVGALLAELQTGDGGGNGGAPAEAPAAPAADDGATAPGEMVNIVLPDMESVTEGVVVEWSVAVGDEVSAEQTVVEVSTDKVDLEVPAPAAGTLAEIAVAAGETFQVGQPLGRIAVGADGGPPSPAAPAPAAAQDGPAAAPAAPAPPAGDLEWPRISPVARRLAIQRGVDPAAVAGTGPGGMVRKADVLAAGNGAPAAAPAPPATAPAAAGEQAVPLRGPAAALAGYMDESLSIPTATSFRTLGVGALDAQRRAINADLTAAGRDEKLSFTHLIAWALVRAAQALPAMGTGYGVVDGGPHKLVRERVNLGLAVDVERKDGSRSLLVPVVRDAGGLGFRGFRDAYDDLVRRTRAGQVKPDELRGASISLTNPGGLGTVASVPRLMPGQGTIVATGAIGYPAGLAAVNGETLASLGVEKVMTVTSTYDHRVIQGAESGEFLALIERMLRGEDGFYEEVRDSLGLPAAAPAPQPGRAAPAAPAPAVATGPVDDELLAGVAAAMSVVKAHRSHGHLAADLDPLGAKPPGDPALVPENLGLTPEVMARIPASLLRVKVPGDSFAAALPHLRAAYCGTIAYEIEHLSDHQKRLWLRGVIESGRLRDPLPAARRVEVLERLVQVDAFERFLRRTYLGQKTFSIEGVNALVPITDEVIELVGAEGARDVVMGMAHRGRLAFISHVVGRPEESIVAEFEGHMAFESGDDDMRETAGDVKYHLGAEGVYETRDGRPVRITLAANPSHLEQVNAVAEGLTRALQTTRTAAESRHDPASAVAVLIHGDAAFTGQGVVAETLNMQALRGYSTGGTVHVIANNQIGFTTDPNDARSTYHVSDLARGFDIPVIHVNGDDIDACISAAQLATAYRNRYQRDVLINLIGYRRLGHNELDEPAYTQPVMSRTIKAHPPVSKIYAQKLVDEGVLAREQVNAMIAEAEGRMRDAHEAVTSRGVLGEQEHEASRANGSPLTGTAVAADVLRDLNEQLLAVPDGFTVHPKLVPQLERRREAMGPEGGITWAHAESLAFASLLTEGVPVRLTGQDTARGTFSHRHLELHDMGEGETWTPHTGRVYMPIAHLAGASASFELYNSPLSEAAAVGFEYGYSTEADDALVLWEAQYGDFVNGAQIMIDQFIVSGRAKWGEASRLTLLLPHGYEGNGPEHSSARIERFLQLAAEDNIRVANCSTAANYFHLLRKQARTSRQRPLIIFTPKSLLRARSAASRLEDLSDGGFQAVYDDPRAAGARDRVTRLILCTGKVFHELDGHADRGEHPELAIARLELLFPFAEDRVSELLASYPALQSVTWVQEEPRNMGAWEFVRLQLERLLPAGVPLGYTGRARRASPSEGYPQAHQAEQDRLLAAAISGQTEG